MSIQHKPPPAPSLAYGDHPHSVANLHLPSSEGGPWPCVVLVHGGFWRSGWDRTLMTPLAHDLARRGIAAWNIEFRRVGQEGGGWPGTFEDAAAAIDHLAGVEQVDTARIATCGHSAGGHLALWLAARHRLASGVGASPRVRPLAAVSQAGVCDLERAWRDDLGDGAVEALLGPLAEGSERLAAASPAALTPLGVPQLLLHGSEDDVVLLSQSRDYCARDRLAELLELEGADHFDVIDADHEAWTAAREWLSVRLGG
ncbi:MAG TPA: alpha/beta hydrolase [Gaiella sp.]|nr:alpha/beta hydrolase [Gaiella sp.]